MQNKQQITSSKSKTKYRQVKKRKQNVKKSTDKYKRSKDKQRTIKTTVNIRKDMYKSKEPRRTQNI